MPRGVSHLSPHEGYVRPVAVEVRRAYYEAAGYGYLDDVSESTWTVSSYEKRVPNPGS
jgi:hypothetical protein